MKINTHLFHNAPCIHTFGSQIASWTLWIVEDGFFEDRQNLVMSWQFPVKPTKKQIRKLRRQFRKSA
ncbi:hypothetical protein P4b_00040 [Klebsiella phage VLCpiP4b]|nr:hypothetical protein P4b_00040 [Klebsiella phage VLCpiP4b]